MAIRLVDLFPRWITPDVFAFLCPHCRELFLTCKRIPLSFGDQYDLFESHFQPGTVWIQCREATAWTFPPAAPFDSLSVLPSIDASAAGHWHGFVTNGAIS